MPAKYFTPNTFKFFKAVKKNNTREWFAKNKARYESDVKAPFLRFIEDFAGPLEIISPHFVADSRPTGGSLFRIYRDTRFSPDKSPYKTSGGAHFRHKRGKIVDKDTGSTWNLFGMAMEGPLAGQRLDPIEHGVYYAFSWLVFNPDTEVVGVSIGEQDPLGGRPGVFPGSQSLGIPPGPAAR